MSDEIRYIDVILKETFSERLDLLIQNGTAFSINEHTNSRVQQRFYKSRKWIRTRRMVIDRDNGCDLGVRGLTIQGTILVHHITPITTEDIINNDPKLTDLDNLICTSLDTHNRIHYGVPAAEHIERRPGDTKDW